MKNLHTPGPWNVTNLETAETVFCIGGQSGSIASAWNKGGGEGEANAKLIAAAPELLEALQYILPALKDTFDTIGDDYSKEAYNKAKEAINKATS